MALINFKQIMDGEDIIQRLVALEEQASQTVLREQVSQTVIKEQVPQESSKEKFSEILYAKNWIEQKYTISNAKIKADSDIFMTCHVGTSSQVHKMFGEACIACLEQKDGEITLVAYGSVPEQDVTVDFLIA